MEDLFLKAMSFLASVEGSSVTIALVLDFSMRFFPSKKPLSVLHLVSSGAKLLGELLSKTAIVLDKVLPQVTKE